jgi:hypothetical protein
MGYKKGNPGEGKEPYSREGQDNIEIDGVFIPVIGTINGDENGLVEFDTIQKKRKIGRIDPIDGHFLKPRNMRKERKNARKFKSYDDES